MTGLSKAEKVLKKFIIQMNQWELKYYPLFRNEGITVHEDAEKKNLMIYMISSAQERKENKVSKYRYHVVSHRSTHQTKKY